MRGYVSVRVLVGAILCFVVAGFLFVSTASSAPASTFNGALRRYPYLTDAVGSSATINWATDRSQSSGAVRYGKNGSESCTAHSVAATKTAITVNSVSEYQWKAKLTLSSGTQYCYRVYLGSTKPIDLLGSDASPSFRTQVPSGSTQSFSFVVLGDWGQVNSSGTNPSQAKLMSLIASSGARFVITTGDNGYPAGSQTNYGDLVQTGSNISAVFGPSFWKVPGASLPIFPALGNHGISSSDTNLPALITWPEDRAVSASNGRYTKETYCCLDGTTSQSYPSVWYAFNAGPARFYVLDAAWSDTNIGTAASPYQVDYDYHWAPGTPQYEWLTEDLAAHPSAVKFAFFHYPMYSDNPTESSDVFLQGKNSAEGLFKQSGVNIVFTGHAHIYQRNRASSAGVVNYVTGGGGATLGSLGTCSSLDAYALGFTTKGKACGSAPTPSSAGQVYHFLKVTVNGTSVTVTPINSLGQSFDVMHYSFTSTSAPALAPQAVAPSISASPMAPLMRTPEPTSIATSATPTCAPTPTPTSLPAVTGTVRETPIATNSPQATSLATVTPAPVATATTACPPTPEGSATATRTPISTHQPVATGTPAATSTSSSMPPQTIVPAKTTSSGTILTFNSEADAQVVQTSPATNFGAWATLRSRGGSGSAQISFIRFTVKGTRDTIQDVKLRLFCTTQGAVNGPAVYLADNNWTESGAGGITWNHQPDILSSEIDRKSAIGTGAWVEYDVSSVIMGDGTYTFALISDSTDGVTFSSREGSASPQLVLTLSP